MIVSKKLGSKGGLTIPQRLRHEAGMLPGAPLDIESADGGLVITKHVPSCCFCGSTENVMTERGVEICAACARELAEKAAAQFGGETDA